MNVSLEQRRSQRSRLRILEAAFSLFATQGYEKTTFRQIAEQTHSAVGLICRYFPTKEHIVMAFYEQITADFMALIPDIQAGSIGARFVWAMRKKLQLLGPHRFLLGHLFAPASDPQQKISVFSSATQHIRIQTLSVFEVVLKQANPAIPNIEQGAALLYGIHLLVILLWLQDQSAEQQNTEELLDLLQQSFDQMGVFLQIPPLVSFFYKLSNISQKILQLPVGQVNQFDQKGQQGQTSVKSTYQDQTQAVLTLLFSRARFLASEPKDFDHFCLPHQQKIETLMQEGLPLHLILPGFPAKSPNPQKVLGPHPDLAEWMALDSLADLCRNIQKIYPPGAKITLCSDGFVFADVVGVSEKNVILYRKEIEHYLGRYSELSLFGLEDAFSGEKVEEALTLLMNRYGISQEAFLRQVEQSTSLQIQLNGIHRFLTEDAMGLVPSTSRSQAQKQTRALAYEVVRRSQAWSRLLSACFPKALRLSIHPQPVFSDKIGIHLLPTEDEWLTPWHGVLVILQDRICLMKRAEAEKQGFTQIKNKGKPSHFEAE